MPKSSSILPGTVLKEKFMEPYQLKSAALAKGIGVYPAIISNVLNNKQRITIPLALRLAKYFKTAEKYWIDLQFNYDFEQAVNDPALKTALKSISPAEKQKAPAKPAAKTAAQKKSAAKPKKPAAKSGKAPARAKKAAAPVPVQENGID
jgi:addiction module HigA family antidote